MYPARVILIISETAEGAVHSKELGTVPAYFSTQQRCVGILNSLCRVAVHLGQDVLGPNDAVTMQNCPPS